MKTYRNIYSILGRPVIAFSILVTGSLGYSQDSPDRCFTTLGQIQAAAAKYRPRAKALNELVNFITTLQVRFINGPTNDIQASGAITKAPSFMFDITIPSLPKNNAKDKPVSVCETDGQYTLEDPTKQNPKVVTLTIWGNNSFRLQEKGSFVGLDLIGSSGAHPAPSTAAALLTR